jgi:hypothetical protein
VEVVEGQEIKVLPNNEEEGYLKSAKKQAELIKELQTHIKQLQKQISQIKKGIRIQSNKKAQ